MKVESPKKETESTQGPRRVEREAEGTPPHLYSCNDVIRCGLEGGGLQRIMISWELGYGAVVRPEKESRGRRGC